MFDPVGIVSLVATVALVGLSAVVHEYAHAQMAYALGDDTAKLNGRLTLNPLAHIDMFGSFILPFLMATLGGPIFSFAKPVPYNPDKLNNPIRDEVLVALAGPLSNILQAIVGTLFLGLIKNVFVISSSAVPMIITWLLLRYVYVNLSLAFFNMLPIPPLDGSKVISFLFKGTFRSRYYKIQAYAMPIFLIAMYVLPSFGFDPVGSYLDATVQRSYLFLLGLI